MDWFHPDSFQSRCIERFRTVTDAPDEFLAGAVMSLTAAALGKNVFVPFAGRALYPNLWVVLVGRSSRLRKSTTLELCRRIFARGIAPAGVKLLPQSCTYEALFDALAAGAAQTQRLGAQRTSTGWFMANEFAAFMHNVKKRYNEGMLEVLTDIYDVPAVLTRQTREAGTVRLTEPCVSLLAATTVEWLTSTLNATDVASGFLPRFLFFPARARTRTLDFPGEMRLADDDALVAMAARLASIQGAMELAPAARQGYIAWSTEFGDRQRPVSTLPGRDAFVARLMSTCLKVAMAGAAGRLARRVEPDDMARACALMDWQDGVIERLLEEEIGFTRDEQRRNAVVRLVRECPRIPRSDLLRSSRLSCAQLDGVLDTLMTAGVIVEERGGRARLYRLRKGDEPCSR